MSDGTKRPPITGRTRVIDESLTLTDELVGGDETVARLSTRLLRLQQVDEVLHWLCGAVSDLGLHATWIRLEGIDDDVDAAIAVLKDELASVASDDDRHNDVTAGGRK